MKLLAILPNNQEVSGFTKSTIDSLRAIPTSFVEIEDTKHGGAFWGEPVFILRTNSKSGLNAWLADKLKYQRILKGLQIKKILLFDSFINIDTTQKQYLFYPSTLSLTDKEKASINKNDFELVTYSEEQKHVLEKEFPNKAIHLFSPEIDAIFKSLDWNESLSTKEKYADGEEYFLVNGLDIEIEEAVHLLKAFSIFKKWQNSSMKIIFLTNDIAPLQEKIANYKYRDDVQLVNNPENEEKSAIIASAYGCIHIPKEDSNTAFALQSIKCQVPLLLKTDSVVAKWLQNNAFLLPESSVENIGQALITMYKAENIRARYIEFYQHFTLPFISENLSFLFE